MRDMDSDNRDYWHEEWKRAEKDGKEQWAAICKDKYRHIVMTELQKEPSMYYIDKLRYIATVYLN